MTDIYSNVAKGINDSLLPYRKRKININPDFLNYINGKLFLNIKYKSKQENFFTYNIMKTYSNNPNFLDSLEIIFYNHFVKGDVDFEMNAQMLKIKYLKIEEITENDDLKDETFNKIYFYIPILQIALFVGEKIISDRSYNYQRIEFSEKILNFPLFYIKQYLLNCITFGKFFFLNIFYNFYIENKEDNFEKLKESQKDLLNYVGISYIIKYIQQLKYSNEFLNKLIIYDFNQIKNEPEEFIIRKRFNNMRKYYLEKDIIYDNIKFNYFKNIFLKFYEEKFLKYYKEKISNLMIPNQFYFSIDYISRTIFYKEDTEEFNIYEKLYKLIEYQIFPIDSLIVYFGAISNIIVKDDLLFEKRNELADKIINEFNTIFYNKFGAFYILEIPYIQKQIFKILTWKIKYLRNNKVKLFIYYWKIESILQKIKDPFHIENKESLYCLISEISKQFIYLKEYNYALKLITKTISTEYKESEIGKILKQYKLICEFYQGLIDIEEFKNKILQYNYKFKNI